ncbi:MAG: iron ABC transporter permease, partial [Mesorhizobium sp.]
SALAGALILSASSVASKSLIPGTIFPIGIVTSLVGIPFFISLILSNVRRSW